jgi:hypothetical protein
MATPTTAAPPAALIPVTDNTTRAPITSIGWRISPYLAVTPALRHHHDAPGSVAVFTGRWQVTHLPTGLPVGVWAVCLHHAMDFAQALAATDIDWAAPREVLAADTRVRDTCARASTQFASCTHPAHCADPDDEDY